MTSTNQLTALFVIMTSLLKVLSLRSGAGFLSSALVTHNFSKRANCEPVRASSTVSMSSSNVNTNPLMNKKSTPLFAEITAAHILPAVRADLDAFKKDFSG